jgi:hypothetical protein
LDLATKTDFCATDSRVQAIPIRFAEDQHIDVANGTVTVFAAVSRSPRAVDVGLVDSFDFGKCGTEHPRHTKCSNKNFCKATEVGAIGVCANESCSPNQPTGRQSCILRSFDLAVHRCVGSSGSRNEVGQCVLAVGVTQDQRQDLGLLLRAKDRQE